jgi:hypothetical protein
MPAQDGSGVKPLKPTARCRRGIYVPSQCHPVERDAIREIP